MPPKRRDYITRYRVNPHTPTVDRLGPCWDFLGAVNSHGYGTIRTPEGVKHAHVVFYERMEGPIPAGMDLDHLCRRPICVRPSHCEPVTRQVNTQRGVRAKLDPAMVARIRRCAVEERAPDSTLAKAFGVSVKTVRRILKGETWANVA